MKVTNIAATTILTLASCVLLGGCGKKMPECSEQSVQSMLNQVLVLHFEKQAAQIEKEIAKKEALNKFFYRVAPVINFDQSLSGIASQKQDKEIGKNYCSAANQSKLSVDFKFRIDPHFAEDHLQLLESVSLELNEQGEDTRFEGNDTLIIHTPMQLSGSIDYTAQYSDNGEELVVRLGKD